MQFTPAADNFIVPITTIAEKYPGGWEQCRRDHAHLIGGRVWYDDHLFRDGAMNPRDIESLVVAWESMGFRVMIESGGEQVFVDACVAERLFGGPKVRCDWFEFDAATWTGNLKGTAPGAVIGRRHFRPLR